MAAFPPTPEQLPDKKRRDSGARRRLWRGGTSPAQEAALSREIAATPPSLRFYKDSGNGAGAAAVDGSFRGGVCQIWGDGGFGMCGEG